MSQKPIYPDRPVPERRSPASKPGAPDHDEWLLDEAIEETFPASDPPAPLQPSDTPLRKKSPES